eukprot:COSAG06_NODE_1307_length_9916_cov_99.462361_7_plen_189_part_00
MRKRKLGPLKIAGDNRLQRLHSVTDNLELLPGASQPAWQPPPGRGGAAGQGGRGLSATESGVDRKRSTTVAYAKQTKAYVFESIKASVRIQRGRKEDFDINRASSHTEKRTVVRARASGLLLFIAGTCRPPYLIPGTSRCLPPAGRRERLPHGGEPAASSEHSLHGAHGAREGVLCVRGGREAADVLG